MTTGVGIRLFRSGLFFLITEVGQHERNGILRFKRADDRHGCANGHTIEQFHDLGIIEHDAAKRLVGDSLRDAMNLNRSGHEM